ncbi:hypothetical protein SPRG_21312 [Saprolegnia parasitica CBS 223.65]|uniref:Uncharacterized protein n=1 Tax=Saprolegnia parasitica (strain CBS 223.65) TaxID=695850 RepID=A0A067BQ18_SAPPC|nr:hypothetical protein SPRG_21312 [Saprolegnia parasitica CBS 223.65]KDO20589.1 hypothetical protein SPRG_21312 [Saprolegnia parasitica CBS 223.65]|eukprot:XP_012208718.1 hypothetical protein SPRG_21312 [Saprolegnia parasitica CBS 223.65]
MAPLTVPVESLDLDDIENAALVPLALHDINFTYPSPHKMAAYVPRRHDEARDDGEVSSEPEVDLDLCHRHAPAYEAQIMTLYMQLDTSSSAAPSSTTSVLHAGLRVALVQHLKHALELEAASQSASAVAPQPMVVSLLLMVLEFALRLELVDVQIAATLAIAVVDTKLSRFTQAHAHVETGLRLGIEIEHRTLLFVAYLCLCDLYVAQRHAERAIEFLHRAKDYALPAWKLSFHANLQILQAIPPVPFSEKLEAWWGLSDERAKLRSEVRTQFGATVLESLTADQLLLALPPRSVLVKVDKLVQYRIGYEGDWTVRDLLRAAIQRHERGQSSSKCLVGFKDPSTCSGDRVLPLHLPLRQCRLHLGLEAVIEPRSTLHAPTGNTPHGYISCSLCQQSISIDAVEEHSQICFQQRHPPSWFV